MDDINTVVQKIAATVKSLNVAANTQEEMVREMIAGEIPDLLSGKDTTNINNTTLDDIESLLQDSNEGVRLNMAVALGKIGPAAKHALPALRTALKNEKDKESKIGPRYHYNDVDAEDAMRDAIQEIQGKSALHHTAVHWPKDFMIGWDSESECIARATAKCKH